MEPALQVDGAAVAYGDLRAVWDASLSVGAGRITALIGRNGAGKTTTLSAILGLLPLRSGRIRLAGTDLRGVTTHRRARMGMGAVLENKRVFRQRTVEENLLLGGFWHYRNRRDMARAVEKACDRFPVLGQKRRMPAATLSGGEQQMLAIAQALMPEPRVLMLDEPSAGLAPAIVESVFESIVAVRSDGLAVLLVEQMVDQALAIADDVVVMELGRTVVNRPVDEVDIAEIERVYLGVPTA